MVTEGSVSVKLSLLIGNETKIVLKGAALMKGGLK